MTFQPAAWPRRLRSHEWYEGTSKDQIYHRGWLKNQGWPHDLFDGRPIIGILNTWSDLTPCNGHLRELAERVKAGVWEAGGFPVEVPVFSASENTYRPTAMMFRNLAALAVEETIRGQPIDGCVLLVGCDKTTPSLLMGAASCDLPSIVVSGGPMLNGWFRGERVGSGTHHVEVLRGGEGRRDDQRRVRRGRGLDEPLQPAPATPWAPPRPWPAWPRRWAWRSPATPRSPASTRAAGSWRS